MEMEWTLNKSQYTKLTQEKKIPLPLLPGFELTTFRSPVWRSTNKPSLLEKCNIYAMSKSHAETSLKTSVDYFCIVHSAIFPDSNEHKTMKQCTQTISPNQRTTADGTKYCKSQKISSHHLCCTFRKAPRPMTVDSFGTSIASPPPSGISLIPDMLIISLPE